MIPSIFNPFVLHLLKLFLVTLLFAVFCVACGGSGGGSTPAPQPNAPDWDLVVDTGSPGTSLNTALLGFYDLSGALYDYANDPNLVTAMSSAGFAGPGGRGADWRVGLGRWELGTEIFPTLTDNTPCPNLLPENQSVHATDLALIASRDWFTYTDGTPVIAADIDDARYGLDYIRSVIDTAAAFGANSYVSIDYMPRALSANQTPNRTDCGASFTNSVTNNQPQDSVVFAKAIAGLVQRVVEGTGSKTGFDRPRVADYWEVWNEPELPLFWEPTLAADPDLFFNMAILTLQELDNYRSTAIDPAAQSLKFGLASFLLADTAIGTLQGFDPANIPMDFISFHDYSDDPLVIVDDIARVETAIQSSTNYKNIELVLGEWGPDLLSRTADHAYAMSMEPALHAATVIALGTYAGLDRAHNAIFYNYNSLIALGALDNNVVPRPLYRAYELMGKLISSNTESLTIQEAADGRMDAGLGAVLVSRDTVNGLVRALLINRNTASRTVQVTLDGTVATPTVVYILDASDDPVNPLRTLPMPNSTIQLPAQAVAVAEF
ncbi:MAG: hypothetical protein KZQ95_16240 [Candidatus Thiodiazotropha sp. (ex Epidulcina cf. delphinae)]|nr:hypothetical protein [Candidatus Thiodiazotropha sp. (ex Epidulcina cf. delphinae)]